VAIVHVCLVFFFCELSRGYLRRNLTSECSLLDTEMPSRP
jgi:hypothetical protein